MNRDLHTAGFYIDICLILLADSLQLTLQNKCYHDTGNDSNYKADQKILAEVKWETVDETAEIVIALIRKLVESGCVIAVGQVGYDRIANIIDIAAVNGTPAAKRHRDCHHSRIPFRRTNIPGIRQCHHRP